MTAPRLVLMVILMLGVIAAPLAAEAQPAGKVYRIGMLSGTVPVSELAGPEPSDPGTRAFLHRLRDLGYVYGQNLVIEARSAEGRNEQLPALAADLVRLKVDVIVVSNTPVVLAAQKATRTIPIVMVLPVDPVGSGLVASLARPGGNTTGLSLQLAEVAGKRVQFIKEVVPALSRLSLLWDPTFSGMQAVLRETEASASRIGLQLQILEARTPRELDSAFATMTRQGARAVIVWGSDILFAHRARIAQLATEARLPAMCPFREYVDAGCLMSYSASLGDLFRRAAVYVDKILKGAKPGDLPVEQPTKFELIINMKTAKALGLTMPQSLLLRADEVIK